MTRQPYRESRFLGQDGLSLYYRDYDSGTGTGVPLLCLAGLTRNSADFAALAEAHSPNAASFVRTIAAGALPIAPTTGGPTRPKPISTISGI